MDIPLMSAGLGDPVQELYPELYVHVPHAHSIAASAGYYQRWGELTDVGTDHWRGGIRVVRVRLTPGPRIE